jgi:ribose transport system substrate-binding protein
MQRIQWALLLPAVVALALLPACSTRSKPRAEGQFGNYTLLATKYDYTDPSKAKDNVADVLTQLRNEPNVCLIGLWAYNPPAILAAVKEANLQGKVKIVGFDEDENTLQGIKDGYIEATVVQQPFLFGYESVKRLADMGKKKIGFVSNNSAEFWTIAEAGCRKAEKEFGVEVYFRRPRNPTAADQKEIIDDLLTKGIEGIAISVIDPVNQHDYLNEIAEKVVLITQDNDAPQTKRKLYIGTDNYRAGRVVGELVKQAMPQGGYIAIFVGQPDPINARERRQGVLDALAGKEMPPDASTSDPAIVHVPHKIVRKGGSGENVVDVEVFHQELKKLLGK